MRIRGAVALAIVIATAGAGTASARSTDEIGTRASFTSAARCDPGLVVNGIAAEPEGLGLVGQSFTCADASGRPVVRYTLSFNGSRPEDMLPSSCTGSDLADGLFGRAGDIVDALGVRCTGPDGDLVGGEGGAPKDAPCPAGLLLTGAAVTFDRFGEDRKIFSIRGLCDPSPFFETAITARPVVEGLRAPAATATLRRADDGAPLPGRTVAFSSRGTPLCEGTTDATGTATCTPLSPGLATLALDDGYDAVFAGDALARPSATRAALLGALPAPAGAPRERRFG